MDPRQALADVAAIREHLVRTEQFRGYRSTTVAFSGFVGLMAAALQAQIIAEPTSQLAAYLAIWISTAAINLAVIGFELWQRTRTAATAVARRTTWFAVEQFAPAVAAGGLITAVIVRQTSDAAWMLPGLWAITFSLGIFASSRLFPRPVSLAGFWYLACGVLALAGGQGSAGLSPWIMAITFGGGQLLTALLLYLVLERPEQAKDLNRD